MDKIRPLGATIKAGQTTTTTSFKYDCVYIVEESDLTITCNNDVEFYVEILDSIVTLTLLEEQDEDIIFTI